MDPISEDLARVLNEQIALLALKLPPDEDHKYGFTCECGCGDIVPLTLAGLRESDGAWLDGHRPDRLVGSVMGEHTAVDPPRGQTQPPGSLNGPGS